MVIKSIKVTKTLLACYTPSTSYIVMKFGTFNPYKPIKGTLANSIDKDQTPQNAASDQGLLCFITKTRLFKYIEKSHLQNLKILR